MLQSELDGIKRMIQKNLIAKENTVDLFEDIDCESDAIKSPLSNEETATACQEQLGSSFLVMSQQDRNGEE